MTDEYDVVSLFEGSPEDKDLFQIMKAGQTKEIHIYVNGAFSFVLDDQGLELLERAVTLAVLKNKLDIPK